MVTHSSYTNHLNFVLCCHHNKILTQDLQLKNRIKSEQRKIVLQNTGKLLLQERIHINPVIRDILKNRFKQLKRKISKSTTREEYHLSEKIHQNL